MKVENQILYIPTYNEKGDDCGEVTFDLQIPSESEAAVETLINVISGLVTDLELLEETNYLKASN